MYDKKFVNLITFPLLDVVLGLELYQVHSLSIGNPTSNMSATVALSKDGLKYEIQSEADCTKCILANNHFCALSLPR